MSQIPFDLKTHLAWQFDYVTPGTFQRNKKDYYGIDFPIICPLPSHGSKTPPLEGEGVSGPFIYFVIDRNLDVHYVGKSKEKTVVKRWVRPDNGSIPTYYWTHTNRKAGCIRLIAEGIMSGNGPFQLRFISLEGLPSEYIVRFSSQYPQYDRLKSVETGFISILKPAWNCTQTFR